MSQAADQPTPRLLRQSSWYFLGNVVGRAVGLLMIPFYTSQLSTSQYGILNLMELATTILAILFGLQSVGDTLTRIYHDQTDTIARRQAVSTALVAAGAASLLAGLLAMLFAHKIARAINLPDQVPLLRASFAAMIFSTMAEIVLVYYRMRERAGFFLAYTMTTLFATLALNIWFIGFLHFGVWGFVSSKLVVTGTGSLVLIGLALKDVGLHWAPHHARALARFGLPLVLSSACFFTIHMSDRLFLAQISQADVGIYSLAYNFAFMLSMLVGESFGNSWNATFYRYAAGENWKGRFAGIAAWLIFVLGAAALGISLVGRDMLRIAVPPSYWPPLLLLPVLVFGYFFREVGDFFRNMLLIESGSATVGRIALAGAVVNITLNWALITGPLHWGIWGAALATAATWILYCAACWILAQRRHRFSFQPWPLLRLLALCAACLALRGVLPVANPFWAVAADAGWFAIFLLASIWLYLNRSQRQQALALITRKRVIA